MTDSSAILDYPAMIDDAMRGVVRKALLQVRESGLPGEHHFYVSFLTTYPGVILSPQLRERYPQEMTIVLQHQYWDLRVEADHFSLMLSFSNVPEKLVVPYAALTAFADPSIKFGLQFHTRRPAAAPAPAPMETETSFELPLEVPEEETNTAQVISLDAFRKK